MIAGDYREKKRINKKGKMVVDKIVTSAAGTEYAIGPKMGQGGVARVFRCRRVRDGHEFAFKEYVPSEEKMKVHRGIRRNLQELVAHPITDKDGSPLSSFIGPIELIDLPASKGFGYVMELVDTDRMVEVKKLWRRYPDARVLCRIGKNVANLFARLHLGIGWCYKDINEGNIYIDPDTGDVCIVDCDNISIPQTKTIKGTTCYMAPEIYDTGKPDANTDKFSMAVYYYRLLVGGYPLDGKKTIEYLKRTEQCIQEAAPVIYGKEALFAFDENDSANSIRSLVSGEDGEMYRQQVKMWDNLPEEIKQCFCRTFGAGLQKPGSRTTDTVWYQCFDQIEKNGLVKCRCGRYNFGSSEKAKKCLFCGAALKKLPKTPAGSASADSLTGVQRTNKPGNGLPAGRPLSGQATAEKTAKAGRAAGKTVSAGSTTAGRTAATGQAPAAGSAAGQAAARQAAATGSTTAGRAAATGQAPAAGTAPQLNEPTGAVFRVKSDQGADVRLTVRRGDEVTGASLHPDLSGQKLFKLQYNRSLRSLAALNLSSQEWIATADGAKKTINPGERVELNPGTVITVLRRKLQLTAEQVLIG